MAIWKLTIEDDEGQKTVVPLVREEYTLGRREGHTIRLTERNVSRDHAKIKKDDNGGYLLEDLGSYNGVFVNGHRVAEPTKLATGDLILIGDYRIEAHNEDAPKQAVSVAPPKQTSAPPVAKPREPVAEKTLPHRLVLLTPGENGGKEFALDKATMIIGRGEEVDIRVNHSSVSRQHCELQSSDQEHFEVVDSGSANGIRVNGQDVKRALLSPGDTLELGDVQLKYIPAGQAFVYDAAAAEAAREASDRPRKGGGMMIVIAIAVIGALIGGIVLAKSGGSTDTPANASTGSSATSTPEMASIEKAYKLKQDGDPVAAHAEVKSITKDSALRKDKRYVEIENAWADKMIASIKAETDIPKKKGILTEILASGADESYRTHAADLLAELEPKPAPSTSDTVVPEPEPTTTVAPTATTAVKPPPTATTTTAKPTATTPPTTTTKPTATAAPPTGKCSVYKGDYVGAMRAKDYECVRSFLMPRLNAGAISTGEARYLKAACGALGDVACEKRAAEKL